MSGIEKRTGTYDENLTDVRNLAAAVYACEAGRFSVVGGCEFFRSLNSLYYMG